jgi:hypothetical protein
MSVEAPVRADRPAPDDIRWELVDEAKLTFGPEAAAQLAREIGLVFDGGA